MTAIKMGLTIEEAAECTGIGRNTMRKLVDWGQAACFESRTKDHYPQGYAGAFYDGQSGQELTQSK